MVRTKNTYAISGSPSASDDLLPASAPDSDPSSFEPPPDAQQALPATGSTSGSAPAKRTSKEKIEKKASEKRKSGGGAVPIPWNARPEEKRRSHSRSYQTLHTGSKIKHLKKLDGEPLWRTDIQYDFLANVFHDERKVFRNSYEASDERFTFADIYIDAMARSSKTSKILCEKLLGDRKAGLNMAMVCLLVNIGRMNTTLNFFPEMRAQLRTYHPIPSLQTYNDQSDYKQLQDAPRLKSILKGACEDRTEPCTLDQLSTVHTFPKSNPINLVFILSTFAHKVERMFFVSPYEFHDLVMNTSLSSESRGQVFLWLMWAFLETDLLPEQLKENPFGFGQENGIKIPEFTILSSEQLTQENVDPEQEIEFGNNMTRERKMYIDTSQQFSFINSSTGNPPMTSAKAKANMRRAAPSSHHSGKLSKHYSGADSDGEGSENSNAQEKEDDADNTDQHDAPGSANASFVPILSKNQHEDEANHGKILPPTSPTQSSAPVASSTPASGTSTTTATKKVATRPSRAKPDISALKTQTNARDTQCQIEINKMLYIKDQEHRRKRKRAGAIYQEWMKIRNHDPLYDSDNEDFPEENMAEEIVTPEDEDLANLLVHKKRKRHVQQQDSSAAAAAAAAAQAAAMDSATNYPDVNGITYSGPNNENLLGNPYNFHISGAALSNISFDIAASLPNTGGKLTAKATVKNRINLPSSYSEENAAMARAFRRSTRWLKMWDAAHKIKEAAKIKEIEEDRKVRDKHQAEREEYEYQHLERILQEERDRLAVEIEMDFEMADQEKKERRHWSRVGQDRAGMDGSTEGKDVPDNESISSSDSLAGSATETATSSTPIAAPIVAPVPAAPAKKARKPRKSKTASPGSEVVKKPKELKGSKEPEETKDLKLKEEQSPNESGPKDFEEYELEESTEPRESNDLEEKNLDEPKESSEFDESKESNEPDELKEFKEPVEPKEAALSKPRKKRVSKYAIPVDTSKLPMPVTASTAPAGPTGIEIALAATLGSSAQTTPAPGGYRVEYHHSKLPFSFVPDSIRGHSGSDSQAAKSTSGSGDTVASNLVPLNDQVIAPVQSPVQTSAQSPMRSPVQAVKSPVQAHAQAATQPLMQAPIAANAPAQSPVQIQTYQPLPPHMMQQSLPHLSQLQQLPPQHIAAPHLVSTGPMGEGMYRHPGHMAGALPMLGAAVVGQQPLPPHSHVPHAQELPPMNVPQQQPQSQQVMDHERDPSGTSKVMSLGNLLGNQ